MAMGRHRHCPCQNCTLTLGLQLQLADHSSIDASPLSNFESLAQNLPDPLAGCYKNWIIFLLTYELRPEMQNGAVSMCPPHLMLNSRPVLVCHFSHTQQNVSADAQTSVARDLEMCPA